MSSDALRNTLDHLALDPDAGTDRHYLVTMLRRLGYSEAEIRVALGDEGEDGRIVEVEYTGPGGSQYTFVKNGKATATFTLAEDNKPATFTLTSDSDAGSEQFSEIDLEDVDVSDDWGDDWGDEEKPVDDTEPEELVEFGGEELVEFTPKLVKFSVEGNKEWIVLDDAVQADSSPATDEKPDDAWADDSWDQSDATPVEEAAQVSATAKRVRVVRVQAESKAEAEEAARQQGLSVRGSAAVNIDADDEVETEWSTVQRAPGAAWEPSEETGTWDAPDDAATAGVDAEEMSWDAPEPAAETESAWAPPADAEAVEGAPDDAEVWADDVAWDEDPATQAEMPAASGDAYTDGDYTLYTRELKLTTGRTQDLYFFAKHSPKAGQPCAMPDGYEVTISEKTGQPYLRKADE